MTQGSPFTFSVHGLVRGRVRGPEALLLPVAKELQFFKEDVAPEPAALDLDVDLELSPADVAPAPSALAWEGRHLIARWWAGLSREGSGPLSLRFLGNRASRFIVSKWIVEPAIRVVMEQKGAAMLHGAALSDGSRAVLVAGAGGAGKTTWTLAWIAAGHPYLSDDFTLVHHGRALAYVTPMRLGLMNLMAGDALSRLPLSAKVEIAVRTLARRLSLGRLKLYYKAMPQTAVPGINISGPAEVAGAVWIGDKQKTGNREMNADEMAARMAEVDREEMHGFGGPASPSDTIVSADFWAVHQSRLAEALRGKPCLSLPARVLPPPHAVSSISSLMEWIRRESAAR